MPSLRVIFPREGNFILLWYKYWALLAMFLIYYSVYNVYTLVYIKYIFIIYLWNIVKKSMQINTAYVHVMLSIFNPCDSISILSIVVFQETSASISGKSSESVTEIMEKSFHYLRRSECCGRRSNDIARLWISEISFRLCHIYEYIVIWKKTPHL